jgi:predicted transcriptional regulator
MWSFGLYGMERENIFRGWGVKLKIFNRRVLKMLSDFIEKEENIIASKYVQKSELASATCYRYLNELEDEGLIRELDKEFTQKFTVSKNSKSRVFEITRKGVKVFMKLEELGNIMEVL